MDLLRYTNPPLPDREKFKVIKPPPQPGFDDTVNSVKESISGTQTPQPRSGRESPTEDVVINFQSTGETQTNVGVTTMEANLLSRVTTMGNGVGEATTTLADEVDPVNTIDDSVLLRMISNMMFYVLRINTISLIIFGLITLMITWGISFMYPLGFLWTVDFFELLQMMKHSRKSRGSTTGKLKRIWLFLDPIAKTITYAGSKGLLVLYLKYGEDLSLSLIYCVIPAAAYELLSSFSSIFSSKQKSLKKMNLAILMTKGSVIFFIASWCLKYENLIDWNWREVLLGYWIIFGFLCGLTFVSLLCVINRCCVFFFAESDQFQVHGVIWAMFILGGKTALSCIVIVTLREVFEKGVPIETMVSPFFMVMSYNLTMLLFTLGYYNEIENFFKSSAAVQDELEGTQTLGFDTQANQPKKPQKIVVPKFLTKSSSTYYRISTESEVKEVREKRKKKQEKLKAKAKAKNDGKEPAKLKEPAKRVARDKTKSIDYTNVKQTTSGTITNVSPKQEKADMLITIAETDQDKATLHTDIDKKSGMHTDKSNNRADKGKDFFSSLTNRTGVVGIIPSVVRRLGLDWKSKKEYEQQEDEQEEEVENYGNMSYDLARRINRSAMDSKREEGNPANIQLKKTGRGQIEGTVLEELEEKLRNSEFKGRNMKKSRMAQSLYLQPKSGGNLNLSAAYDPEVPSADSSMVEDPKQAPSGDTSMTGQCLICFDLQPDAVFMDCGHGGICYECAVEIWKAAGECYLCRNKIVQVLQIDLKYKHGDVIKVISSTQMINWEEQNAN